MMDEDVSSLQYFALAMKAYRQRRKLSQHDLAEMSGVSVVSVNVVEGAKRGVALATLEKIAKALDTKLSEMIEYGYKLAMQGDKSSRYILGSNVKLLREAAGLTQTELATKAGLSLSTVAGIEVARKSAGVDVIHNLAVALSVPIGRLFSED